LPSTTPGLAASRIDALELVVARLLLQPLRSLARHGFVQRIQPGDRDVLSIAERQRILLLPVLRQGRFRVGDLLFLLDHFLAQPFQVLLIRRETKFQVLRRIFLG
jgi:hypothetical protein